MKTTIAMFVVIPAAALLLPGCTGILSGIYDEPAAGPRPESAGELRIDATAWDKWYYIDLESSPDSASPEWVAVDVPRAVEGAESATHPDGECSGIYTYWYDVFGVGVENREYQGFAPAEPMDEPEQWTIAVHRNNVRTNGCEVAATPYESMQEIPSGRDFIESLEFAGDEWDVTSVWVDRDRMLLGVIGNQGVYVNHTLGDWLKIEIPPMPPVYSHNPRVFILRRCDGSYMALRLADYRGDDGTACVLTIEFKLL